jgi:hypothetical protein
VPRGRIGCTPTEAGCRAKGPRHGGQAGATLKPKAARGCPRELYRDGGASQVHGFGGHVCVFQAGTGVEDYYAVSGI